jgi:hypothetical protein
MNQGASPYIVSFQAEGFHKRTRYHWTICGVKNPEQLISWGYAPSQILAETAARQEVADLTSGITQGGRMAATFREFTRR